MTVEAAFTIDVLPGYCRVEGEIDPHSRRARFRAVDRRGRPSEWSGLFDIGNEPITLTWSAFEWPKRRRWWQ